MTSNVKRHVQLPRSSQKGKKPTAEDLKYGEIAVNFNVEEPFLAMKGSDDSIITMGFKDGKTGPWKKGEGEYSAVLDNGIPSNPSDKVNTATKRYATAEGQGSTASGDYSHAEGTNTTASGLASHAEGEFTTASGESSHAEGSANTASADSSHAEGNGTTADGESSHAEGFNTKASGNQSHAEGKMTTADGESSHVEGSYTIVKGSSSHGEGKYETNIDLVRDIAVGDTQIAINNSSMNLPTIDEYIKNCFIVNKADSKDIYKFISYSVRQQEFNGLPINIMEINLDKSLKKASSNDGSYDDNPSFISEEYILINVAVGEADGGHSEGKNNIVLGEAGHAEGIRTIAKGYSSHAEGENTIASGQSSHAEGELTTASGVNSHAEGTKTIASGQNSHTEGSGTTASNIYSHAEGNSTTSKGRSSHAEGYITIASGDNSHAEGNSTTADSSGAHAEGNNTKALAPYAHAEGNYTRADSDYSHAEGNSTNASGNSSHSEGNVTIARGEASHAEGQNTKAIGNQSHAEGNFTIAMGLTSHAEGDSTNSAGIYSHAEGKGSIALGDVTHVEGLHSRAMNFTDDVAAGSKELYIITNDEYPEDLTYYKNCLVKDNGQTVAIDVLNAELVPNSKFTNESENKRIKLTLKDGVPKASTRASQANENQKDGYFYTWNYTLYNKGTIGNYGGHAEGSYTMVYEESGHAEGKATIAKGKSSHAEGHHTIAIEDYSHSEGVLTTATGVSSHAEGGETNSEGDYSHAEGNATYAKGDHSHAEGNHTKTNGEASHASGSYTIAENDSEFACGKYNKFNVNQIFSIGVGTADNARKNALYITTDGVIGGDSQLTNGGTSMFGLKINGGIQASEGMISPTYLNSSDERLKKDIETISDNDIDKVKNVNLKSYVFKSDNSKHYGVIAQDVEKAGLSELVTNGADGMKSVDYISLLILKITELENEIKNLKEQINK